MALLYMFFFQEQECLQLKILVFLLLRPDPGRALLTQKYLFYNKENTKIAL